LEKIALKSPIPDHQLPSERDFSRANCADISGRCAADAHRVSSLCRNNGRNHWQNRYLSHRARIRFLDLAACGCRDWIEHSERLVRVLLNQPLRLVTGHRFGLEPFLAICESSNKLYCGKSFSSCAACFSTAARVNGKLK